MPQNLPAAGQWQRHHRRGWSFGGSQARHRSRHRQQLPSPRVRGKHTEDCPRARQDFPFFVDHQILVRSEGNTLLVQCDPDPLVPRDGIGLVVAVGEDRTGIDLTGQGWNDGLRRTLAHDQPMPQALQIAGQRFERAEQEVHPCRAHVRRLQDRFVPAKDHHHPIRLGIRLPQRRIVGNPKVTAKPMENRFQEDTLNRPRTLFNSESRNAVQS